MSRAGTTFGKTDNRTNVIATFGEFGFYGDLRYRGEPTRAPGEQAQLVRVRRYNARFADALSVGMSLADADDYAKGEVS